MPYNSHNISRSVRFVSRLFVFPALYNNDILCEKQHRIIVLHLKLDYFVLKMYAPLVAMGQVLCFQLAEMKFFLTFEGQILEHRDLDSPINFS